MSVISIKKKELNKKGFVSLEQWLQNSNHVYIGRNMEFYVKGAKASKWRNPFSVKKYGRDEALRLYKEYIVSSGLVNQIGELKGKVLGCWCKPEMCHGDVLTEMIKQIQ